MKCIVCDGSCAKKTIWGGYYFKGRRYAITRCINCGFMFLDPMPGKDVLDDIYDGEGYFDNYYAGAGKTKGYIAGMEDRRGQDTAIINIIRDFKVNGKLLDIGCASGSFLITAKDAGYDVFGIEPSRKMAGYAKDMFGLDVCCGTLAEAGFEDRSFDIVYAGDVLEHIPELETDIENIKRLLADKGILVINQPLTYNRSLYNIFLQINMLFKRNRFAPNPPSHLWEFNAATLNRFLKKAGLEIIYYAISETRAKPSMVYERFGVKNRLGQCVKDFSSVVSGVKMLRGFNLGDRALVVCRKR